MSDWQALCEQFYSSKNRKHAPLPSKRENVLTSLSPSPSASASSLQSTSAVVAPYSPLSDKKRKKKSKKKKQTTLTLSNPTTIEGSTSSIAVATLSATVTTTTSVTATTSVTTTIIATTTVITTTAVTTTARSITPVTAATITASTVVNDDDGHTDKIITIATPTKSITKKKKPKKKAKTTSNENNLQLNDLKPTQHPLLPASATQATSSIPLSNNLSLDQNKKNAKNKPNSRPLNVNKRKVETITNNDEEEDEQSKNEEESAAEDSDERTKKQENGNTGEGGEEEEDENEEEEDERKDTKNKSAQKILEAIRKAATNNNNADEEGKAPVQKEFLLSQSPLSEEACANLRKDLGIEVSPVSAPPPVESSEDPVLPKLFSTFMTRSKLAQPSAIQAQAWPVILSGKDVIAIGATGSGKTIAYLLPIVPHILANRQHGMITGLVLVPTRELAIQVSTVARSFRSLFGVSCYTVYGGADKAEQEAYLSEVGAVDVLVATPGRLCDLIGSAKVSLAHVSYLVLDEADKMLEGSLGEQVSVLMGLCRGNAQRLVFSATLPPHMREAIQAFVQTSCVEVKVRESEGGTSLGAHIKQTLHVTSDAHHKKLRKLLRTLIQINTEHAATNPQVARNQRPSVMIFVNKIKTISSVVGCLQKATRVVGISRGLSGNMRQTEREEVINGFRAGKFNNLVTTDLAGRGMDIKRLNHVINFDFPPTIPQYIHRVGRAGRQGQPSTTFTFFTRNRKGLAPHILRVLQQTNQWEDPNLLSLCKEAEAGGGGDGDEGDNIDGHDNNSEPSNDDTEELGSNVASAKRTPTPTTPKSNYKEQKGKEVSGSVQQQSTRTFDKKKQKTKSSAAGKRKSSGDPHGIPSWLLQNRTMVADSDSEGDR